MWWTLLNPTAVSTANAYWSQEPISIWFRLQGSALIRFEVCNQDGIHVVLQGRGSIHIADMIIWEILFLDHWIGFCTLHCNTEKNLDEDPSWALLLVKERCWDGSPWSLPGEDPWGALRRLIHVVLQGWWPLDRLLCCTLQRLEECRWDGSRQSVSRYWCWS